MCTYWNEAPPGENKFEYVKASEKSFFLSLFLFRDQRRRAYFTHCWINFSVM